MHQRSQRASRFPGYYEVLVGGAVAVGESYEEAAGRELGVSAAVRFRLKFLNRSGLSPHWLAVHEAVVPAGLTPNPDEISWHGWLAESELAEFMRQHPFTPDSGPTLDRYLRQGDVSGRPYASPIADDQEGGSCGS
ncbi:NUDIX domain-containing protein [Streptomyces sp. NPDC001928]|uniref:NUDIX domain-containing protein n=1 Tax=Streptomyces sp. NPDC001928 TaxID=3154404 RepID=UPI00332C3338